MLWYYVGGALLTLVAAIFVVALNAKDNEERVFLSGLAVVAAGFWPITWIILLVAGAAYKVKELKEEQQ